MATLADVYTETRAHLADVAAEVWTDGVLLPFTNRAYRTCARYLRSKDTGIFRRESAPISVATTDVGLARTAVTNYPTYLTAAPLLLRPIEIREALSGGSATWTAMRSSDGFMPIDAKVAPLEIWDWRNDRIIFPSHTAGTVLLQILYDADLTEFTSATSSGQTVAIPDALDALALMTASFVAKSRDEKGISEMFKAEATADLDLIARAEAAVKKAAGARWGTQ